MERLRMEVHPLLPRAPCALPSLVHAYWQIQRLGKQQCASLGRLRDAQCGASTSTRSPGGPLPGRRQCRTLAAAAPGAGAGSGSGSGGRRAKQAAAAKQQQQQQAPQQQQQAPQQQQTSQQGQAPQQYLYESKYGLPVVRRRLSYSQLLRAIRQEEVADLHFFTGRGGAALEGPCLVAFRDGTTAQAFVPEHDFRVAYAMETHGVQGRRLGASPTAAELAPAAPLSRQLAGFVTDVLPYLAIAAVYAATSYVRWKKGDAEDREKIRRKAAEDAKRREREAKADLVGPEAEAMARMGYSVEDILEKLQRSGFAPEREVAEAAVMAAAEEAAAAAAAAAAGEVGGAPAAPPPGMYNTGAAEQLADLEAWRAKMEEERAEGDPQAQAEEMLKMKTVKIQKAKDPAKQRALRQAQSKLKGIKLQYTDASDSVFFEDVAGIGDAKVELQEIVDFFRKPERFRQSGSRIPRGVLLCGPPGTGKTLLARAVAGEAGASFLSLNASEFVEMFVGVGASRVRDLFSTARSMSPAIIFIDEIDSVGRIRGGAKGNDERDQTLNQMLSEMDGFDNDAQVIVMAATNRRDILDPALVRPGRFDRIIYVPLPDYNGRIEILSVHLSKRPYSPDIDLHELAFETSRYSGAQLANLVNMAATIASQGGREEVAYADLLAALEFERLGPKRAPYSATARRRLAVQEGATALACTLLPAIEPVVQVTIVPREKYPLGQTVLKANEQRELTQLFTARYLREQLLTTLAGRAAEELVYGEDEMSTIQQRRLVLARRVAQKLVASNAMAASPAVGPRTLSTPRKAGGRALKQVVTKFVPSDVHAAADAEVEALLAEAYAGVKSLLTRNRAALDALVEALLERDTLGGEEVRGLVEAHGAGEDLRRRADEQAVFM